MRSKLIRRKALLFFVLFFVFIGFIAIQIPINTLEGSKVKFTLFDLVAPISGAFLGTGLGIVSVLAMYIVNLVTHGFAGVNASSPLTLVATLRFLPLIVGVWFFAKKEGKLLILPALSILAFNLHPIGRTVWFYSLLWTIPFILWPLRGRFLIARSLAATFSAHAVGGAVWIWAFNLPANVWVSLIPVVILERSIFALGISASYILMNNVLGYLAAKKFIPRSIEVDKRYLLKF
ncbi:hypothetical protein HYZ70_01885 [Candidatus Curtissbacteria bacterium]|nr:hypothetical protein [Candidatus Curtissbacteria bacterium]